jgi:hypothetical protein
VDVDRIRACFSLLSEPHTEIIADASGFHAAESFLMQIQCKGNFARRSAPYHREWGIKHG